MWALAGWGGVLCRATPSCPFVFPASFQHAILLTPLAFAFGFRAWSARAPFGVPARAVRGFRPALSPLRSVRLRSPLCSARPRSLELYTYKSGASGVRVARYRGFAPQRRSPSRALRPACEPFGLFDCIRSLAFAGGCRAGVSGGCRAGVSNGATRLTDTPALLERKYDFTLTLP